jgi:recombinational DNA repair ATPase RecF
MTPTELSDRVAIQYPDRERIGDTVVQFTRRVGGRPFAVYYLDCGNQIPTTLDELRSYQDRVIGGRYFQGAQSLQWSNYLYFVTDAERLHAPATAGIRELLEQDRTVARKFLIDENELGGVLKPDVVSADPTSETSVLSTWNTVLAQNGLGRAIWNDNDLPRRLTLLETAAPSARSASEPTSPSTVKPGQWLKRLQMDHFRDYPLLRDVPFGLVNLIFGPNASGKTSLMEAIELFYCGRTKRSPGSSAGYDLTATLADGTKEHATDTRPQKLFRDRNLAWYGQLEVKTHDLYLSFARFNFLDTDAAVRLADDTDSIEKDLSKLLIGPAAAKTWENMSKVLQAGRARLKELRDDDRRLQKQIADIDALLQTLSSGSGSDLLRERLQNMLQVQNWQPPADDDPDDVAARVIGPLAELVPLVHQVAALPLSPSPSRSALARYIRTAATARDKASNDIAALAALEQQIGVVSATLASAREASTILDRAKRLVAAGLPTRMATRDRLRQAVAQLSNQVTGINAAAMTTLATARPAAIATAFLTQARQNRTAAAQVSRDLNAQQNRLKATRTRSLNLAEELRSIARQYLSESKDESECPLCHTWFKPGELVAHINRELTKQFHSSEQELETRVRAADVAARNATAEEAAAAAAVAFAQRAELNPNATLAQVSAALTAASVTLAEQSQQLRAVEAELQTLERQGIRWADLDPLRVELVRRRFLVSGWTDGAVTATAAAIAKSSNDLDKALAEHTRNADKLKQQLTVTLGSAIATSRDGRVALTGLEQQISIATTLAGKLATLARQLRIPMNKPLGELAVEAEAIRAVALELQSAIQQESDNNAVRTQSTATRAQLLQEVEKLAPRIKNLATATNVLQRLQRDHSIDDAMKDALQRNRAAIESIFVQIHTPHEFSGLGEKITELCRRNGKISDLAQISTGQRAALGLSIFLAQNMKLVDAPPVILIDDPIAHVDDLNCLAFLDYLREIALSRRRQIVFATANDKLAAIFERKFDFLGQPDFHKIELHREAPSPVATIQ